MATTGLHGSIGAKFAEYIAQAKAIVSEPLNYQVPGNLSSEVNYLEFTSIDGCVESAVRLIDDRDLRVSMMMDNCRYYHAYLRPDALILNTLAIAMSKVPANSAR